MWFTREIVLNEPRIYCYDINNNYGHFGRVSITLKTDGKHQRNWTAEELERKRCRNYDRLGAGQELVWSRLRQIGEELEICAARVLMKSPI